MKNILELENEALALEDPSYDANYETLLNNLEQLDRDDKAREDFVIEQAKAAKLRIEKLEEERVAAKEKLAKKIPLKNNVNKSEAAAIIIDSVSQENQWKAITRAVKERLEVENELETLRSIANDLNSERVAGMDKAILQTLSSSVNEEIKWLTAIHHEQLVTAQAKSSNPRGYQSLINQNAAKRALLDPNMFMFIASTVLGAGALVCVAHYSVIVGAAVAGSVVLGGAAANFAKSYMNLAVTNVEQSRAEASRQLEVC